MLSVVLAGRCSSFILIVLDTLRSTMLPSVVVKPPTFTEYFSVVDVVAFRVVIGRFASVDDDDAAVVVGSSSKVLLL